MRAFFALLGAPFRRLPFCSLPGAVAGSFAGFVMTLLLLDGLALLLTPQQLLVLGLLVGTTGWLLVLLLFGMILRYGVGVIFWPALANALITAILAMFVNLWLQMPVIAGLVGLLIGILVGALLCRFCGEGKYPAHA